MVTPTRRASEGWSAREPASPREPVRAAHEDPSRVPALCAGGVGSVTCPGAENPLYSPSITPRQRCWNSASGMPTRASKRSMSDRPVVSGRHSARGRSSPAAAARRPESTPAPTSRDNVPVLVFGKSGNVYNQVHVATFTPDGKRVLFSNDTGAFLEEIATGKKVLLSAGNGQLLGGLTISSDGNIVMGEMVNDSSDGKTYTTQIAAYSSSDGHRIAQATVSGDYSIVAVPEPAASAVLIGGPTLRIQPARCSSSMSRRARPLLRFRLPGMMRRLSIRVATSS